MGSDPPLARHLLAWCVSIHAPTWGATFDFRHKHQPHLCFNPRSHVGATLVPNELRCRAKFQSTLPRGERPDGHSGILIHEGFQSTLPRGERPLSAADKATTAAFQSTLPRGERRYRYAQQVCASCFNPRSHVGSDWSQCSKYYHVVVSIHAPTWGATLILWHSSPNVKFQSTLPRGERHVVSISVILPFGFNPRSHVGSDAALT